MQGYSGNHSIAFDAQPLLGRSKSGVGFHEDGLVRNLMRLYPQDDYLLDFFSWKGRGSKRDMVGQYAARGNIRGNECRWFPGTLYRMACGIIPLPYRAFFGKKADVTHFFNFCVPPGVHGKKVVTVHDMAVHRCPETVRPKTRAMLRLNLGRSLKRADAIIAVSEFTKEEIKKYYHVPPGKIHVVPNGVDTGKFRPGYSEGEKASAKARYGIAGKYFLYMGNVEPRKNLVRLVDAYLQAREHWGDGFPALVIGGARGWLCEGIYQSAEAERDIRFIGYVADGDVPALMCGAEAFCFVSLYEGFGMPVLEAMACGTPVLTSDSSAMAEVAGDAAVKVDPLETGQISAALAELCRNGGLREECRRRGLERAKAYSWESAARKLHGVYETILGQERGE